MISFKEFLLEADVSPDEIRRNTKFSDLHKTLTRSGWTQESSKGPHYAYSHPDTRQKLRVPRQHSKELSIGTVRDILSKSRDHLRKVG
jgi:predicted RNA binding protein YcfA (HicA-like mRNA interferase family)